MAGPPTLTHLLASERARRPGAEEPAAESQAQTHQWFEAEPLWFKRAVFYEIHIRGFYDANGDGSGDVRGLTEKLDYLQWLGIDCIWLLPFYESPAARRRLRHLRLLPRFIPTTGRWTTSMS